MPPFGGARGKGLLKLPVTKNPDLPSFRPSSFFGEAKNLKETLVASFKSTAPCVFNISGRNLKRLVCRTPNNKWFVVKVLLVGRKVLLVIEVR